MEQDIIITDYVKKQIVEYYSNLNIEAICAVFLSRKDNFFVSTRFFKFNDIDYKYQGYKTVCLKAEKMKEIINIANTEQVDMLLIIHNHTVFLPYLSNDDKRAMHRITDYLTKRNIPIIHGIGVYTCGILTLCIDYAKKEKRKYCNLRRKSNEKIYITGD